MLLVSTADMGCTVQQVRQRDWQRHCLGLATRWVLISISFKELRFRLPTLHTSSFTKRMQLLPLKYALTGSSAIAATRVLMQVRAT
jgi:hypothetical protein